MDFQNDTQADRNSVWRVIHSGPCNHPAPQPSQVTKESKKKFSDNVKVTQTVRITEFVTGNTFQSPTGQVNVEYTNTNYLQNVKAKPKRQLSNA